jgi:hypothetical protein
MMRPSGDVSELLCDTEYLDNLKISGQLPLWRQACSELTEKDN